MASSATKRIWYAQYACQKSGVFPRTHILIGDRKVCPVTVEAFRAFDQALRLADYNAVSVGTYNCRPITGGRKLSLHAYGIAPDIDPYALGNPFYGRTHPKAWKFSWSDTKFTQAQVEAVEGIRTNNGKKVFLWGGRWLTIKDYMHWEIDVAPSDLATGINWKTVPGGILGGEDNMLPLKLGDKNEDVRLLQDRLNETFDTDLVLDADYGPATMSAAATHLGKYTNETAGKEGKKVNANMWNGLLRDFILKVGGGVTQDEGDDRWVRRGVRVTSKFS